MYVINTLNVPRGSPVTGVQLGKSINIYNNEYEIKKKYYFSIIQKSFRDGKTFILAAIGQ